MTIFLVCHCLILDMGRYVTETYMVYHDSGRARNKQHLQKRHCRRYHISVESSRFTNAYSINVEPIEQLLSRYDPLWS